MRRKCGNWAESGWANETAAQRTARHNQVPALRPALQPLTRAFPVRIEFDLMFGDTRSIVNDMQAVGYVRVSTERQADQGDRKSTRLNSSHLGISYAVFCF